VVGKQRNTQILVYLLVPYVLGGSSSKAKTLGLQHMHLPDMGAGCGSPSWARIIHHGADEQLI
jgi:O-acetyl-ADP-ribose deacetylase (regulator of RNase III)